MGDIARREGFSLLEILVALAVFSLAAMALLNLSGESVRSAARVQDRTLGGIVADNVAAAAVSGLDDSASAGDVQLGGRGWHWRREVRQTGVAGLEQIEVRVTPLDDSGNDSGNETARRIMFRSVGPS